MPERSHCLIEHRDVTPDTPRFKATQAYGFAIFGLPEVKVGLHYSGETVNARGYDFRANAL